ncbi:outer membrane putative beta-barrel porin/alpha-amylase [Flavobacterium sp. 103]|uniref:transporter n=1 Tax=Flavobacterium sp. 103 TaxID=2135624 RepID=UPI000D5F3172|nr:transporter [Flavobacterium sp. 103]PVX45791.1 outer membrane putative beta-barrel porin/alpha-amylase [Flavobacterium sp. 103]
MKKFILIISFLSISNYAISQDLPSIQTDRPDQTECPFITPKGYLQFENGFSYEKIDGDSKSIVAPTILTKFGINDHFELRLITEYSIEKNNSSKISGINPVLIGFKTRLFEEKGIIPTTSFITHLGLPKLASSDLKATYYTPEFRFTMQHTISDRQTLSYNLGAEWSGVTLEPTFIYTLTTGYSFSEKIGGYIEFFGFIPQIEKPDHRFDGGLTYLFNPNHQLDVSAGFGLSKISPEYYFALGYSFRFKI